MAQQKLYRKRRGAAACHWTPDSRSFLFGIISHSQSYTSVIRLKIRRIGRLCIDDPPNVVESAHAGTGVSTDPNAEDRPVPAPTRY
jgi:hypothetical protein